MITIEQQIELACKILHQGGVIAYPTEAVYGIGCNPNSNLAIKHLLSIKHRAVEKGLILLSHDFSHFYPYISCDAKDYKLLSVDNAQKKAIHHKGVTWLFPKKNHLSQYISGNHNTVAIRVSHHPIVRKLCETFDGAIISTSANLNNHEPAKTVLEIHAQFGRKIDCIVDAPLGKNTLPSTIKHIETDQVIRHGH